MLFES